MGDDLGPAKEKVQNLIRRIEALQELVAAPPDPLEPFIEGAVEGIATEFGAMLSKKIFGRRGPGTKVGRRYVRERVKAATQARQSEQRKQALALVTDLEQLIRSISKHLSSRTRRPLLKALRHANEAKRADTILRRAESLALRITEVEPEGIRTPSTPDPANDFLLLRNLEQGLRGCVERHLSALTQNWWKERVPSNIMAEAEGRQSREERIWPGSRGKKLSPINYVNFTEYSSIISRKNNWKDAFQAVFLDKEIIRAKLRELEPIRNSMMHARDLTSDQRAKLELFSNEIIQLIKEHS